MDVNNISFLILSNIAKLVPVGYTLTAKAPLGFDTLLLNHILLQSFVIKCFIGFYILAVWDNKKNVFASVDCYKFFYNFV